MTKITEDPGKQLLDQVIGRVIAVATILVPAMMVLL